MLLLSLRWPSPPVRWPGRPDDPRTRVVFGEPICPAEADPAVWQELPGVGPATARRLASAPVDEASLPPSLRALLAGRVAWEGAARERACAGRLRPPPVAPIMPPRRE